VTKPTNERKNNDQENIFMELNYNKIELTVTREWEISRQQAHYLGEPVYLGRAKCGGN